MYLETSRQGLIVWIAGQFTTWAESDDQEMIITRETMEDMSQQQRQEYEMVAAAIKENKFLSVERDTRGNFTVRKLPGYPVLRQAPAKETNEAQASGGVEQRRNLDFIRNLDTEEASLLTSLDVAKADGDIVDGRWASIARTHFEQGFMALRRALGAKQS